MIAMSMTSTYEEYRRDAIASAPVYPAAAHPLRRMAMRLLATIGVGVAGTAAEDDDEPLGIG